jgi:hypothetical protein
MVEPVKNIYKRLFEIRLLHHYWLDEGVTIFDLIGDQDKKDKLLLSYDRRTFLAVTPTATTAKVFNGLGCVHKNTALGCVVAVPDTVVISVETEFIFMVTVSAPAVFNYTSLTLQPRGIYEVYYQPEDKTYRYKENVPVLSNLTGTARGTGNNKALYLSKEIPNLASDDKVESLVRENNSLMQLTSDQPGADLQELSAQATDLPVFVHQGDIPVITSPAGLTGAPQKGILLSDDIPDNVFFLIHLAAIRSDDDDFSFINSDGQAKMSGPVYQVRLKNRSTIWQYLDKNSGAVISTESESLPLTHFGNAGTKQKPSEGLVKAEMNGNKISRLISEIFL